jgi:hypothetical protein
MPACHAGGQPSELRTADVEPALTYVPSAVPAMGRVSMIVLLFPALALIVGVFLSLASIRLFNCASSLAVFSLGAGVRLCGLFLRSVRDWIERARGDRELRTRADGLKEWDQIAEARLKDLSF